MSRKRVLFLTIVIAAALLLLLRGPVLRLAVLHKAKSIERHHSLVVHFDGLRFKGMSTIKIDRLTLMQKDRDSLFSASGITLKLNAFKLLLLRPDIRKLEANKVKFVFIKNDNSSNFDFLFSETKGIKKDTVSVDLEGSRHHFSRNADRIFSLLLDVLPSRAEIKKMSVSYKSPGYRLTIFTPLLKIERNNFSAIILNNENGRMGNLFTEGTLDHSHRMVSVRLSGSDGKSFQVPFINYRWGARARFDTLSFKVAETVRKGDFVTFSGRASGKYISVNHKRLSVEDVKLDKGAVDFSVNIGSNYFELDSCSTVTVNKIEFSPYLRLGKDEKWRITASLNKKDFPADDLFASLPEGLFYNLRGLKTNGTLSYHFLLDIDFANLDSLKLESALTSKNFRITGFGLTDFRKINDEFEYTAYDRGVPVRTMMIGPSNGNFRTLDRISPYLQTAVLQSEDGGFFYHRGFLPGSIREALIQDLKEKKFLRGGSSISMQLVKNIFLSKNKTLTRKFEEVLIVWLIENNHLSTKERMFEVYLNIIEWGPDVYGANEAARFYFDKDAKDINANEAIFLSSIIPAPKWALNSFDDNFQLKPSMEGYYKLLAQRLRIKGLISESEEAEIRPEVHVRGEARKLLKERQEKDEAEGSVIAF